MWSEVQPNELVFIQDGNGRALGPHRVVDPQAHTVCNVALGESHTVDDEILLYKKGPLVVATELNGKFNAVYADVPLEIVVVRMEDNGPQLFTSKSLRPRGLDDVPTDYQKQLARTLPPGYPGVLRAVGGEASRTG